MYTKLYGVLDADSFHKIFPQQYYTKFAPHLKVLQFEKQLFQIPPETGKLKFTKHKTHINLQSHQPLNEKTNVKLSKFAKINDTLAYDKQQLIRFKAISRNIDLNLLEPQLNAQLLKKNKTNEIQTLKNNQEIDLTVIDNMMLQSNRETDQKIKEKLEELKNKQVLCRFVKRNIQKTAKDTYNSKMQWKSMKRYNSQKKILSTQQKQMGSSAHKMDQNFSKKLSKHNLNSHEEAHIASLRNNLSSTLLKVPLQSFAVKNQKTKCPETKNKGSNQTTRPRKYSQRWGQKQAKSSVKFDWIGQTERLKANKDLIKSLKYSSQVINQSWKNDLNSILKEKQTKSPQELNPQN